MGNLVVFRREIDAVHLDLVGGHYYGVPASRDASAPGAVQASSPWASAVVSKRFAREEPATTTRTDPDGYLLVMLADQEHSAGRQLQALTLLDAAYAAFDRQAQDHWGS